MLNNPHVRYIFVTNNDLKTISLSLPSSVEFHNVPIVAPCGWPCQRISEKPMITYLMVCTKHGRSANSLWCSTLVLRPMKTTFRWAKSIFRIRNSGEKIEHPGEWAENYDFLDGRRASVLIYMCRSNMQTPGHGNK